MSEKRCSKRIFIPLLFIAVLLAIVFFYSRFVIGKFGTDGPWASYLYTYGFGLIFFGSGIWLGFKSGATKLGRGRDTLWIKWLIGGFLFFAIGHALWILLALNTPVKGGY